MRIDAEVFQEHRVFQTVADIPQQTVPVRLRLIGCLGGEDDIIMRETWITVVGNDLNMIQAPHTVCHFKRLRRGEGKGNGLLRFLSVDRHLQAACALHIQKHAALIRF